MILGILQFDLHIHDAQSLKDKRKVVLSVKDRLHREHMVAVAEVAHQDMLNLARLGLAMVGSDGKHVGQTLDRILAKLRQLTDAELGEVSRQVLEASQIDGEDDDQGNQDDHSGEDIEDEDTANDALARELIARAESLIAEEERLSREAENAQTSNLLASANSPAASASAATSPTAQTSTALGPRRRHNPHYR